MDLVGIEPTTSSMPWKRAPSCATGPHFGRSTTSILAHAYRIVKPGAGVLHQKGTWERGPTVAKPEKMSILSREEQYPMKIIQTAVVCLVAVAAFAQTAANPATSAPVSYTSIAELNQLIANLQAASQTAQQDLARLRIERWKTDGNTKKQTQGDADSIAKNLQNALPTILSDLKNSPENLALTFKTYRNLDALYDVLSSVAESAGAFGSKDEFQSLSNDLGAIESSRRAFAERMDKLANAKETEMGQLRAALQAARAATPPKKVVVDDSEPATKKAPVKKKPAPKPATAPAKTPTPSRAVPPK